MTLSSKITIIIYSFLFYGLLTYYKYGSRKCGNDALHFAKKKAGSAAEANSDKATIIIDHLTYAFRIIKEWTFNFIIDKLKGSKTQNDLPKTIVTVVIIMLLIGSLFGKITSKFIITPLYYIISIITIIFGYYLFYKCTDWMKVLMGNLEGITDSIDIVKDGVDTITKKLKKNGDIEVSILSKHPTPSPIHTTITIQPT